MKPQEVVHQSYGAAFTAMCRAAQNFWQLNTMPRTHGPVIVVDLLAQDVRVAIRCLTLAASMQRHMNARLVALIGPDSYWADMIWSYYDAEKLTELAEAYGVEDLINMRDLVERSIAGERTFEMLGETVEIPTETDATPERYREIAEATHMRALRIPLVTEEIQASDEYQQLEQRNEHYARIYDAMMRQNVHAFVTSHIDYHQWGFAVDAAMREQVEVHHVQSTGSLKSYALFPEKTDLSITARMNWTLQIADFFEQYVWPARRVLRRAAETAMFRSKSNFGRPSWWRGGGSISELGFTTAAERESVRHHTMRSLGFDPSKPVVAVYNHAISDAVHSNHEIFDNLADWFTSTVEFASKHPEANWLLLDHPAQLLYDGTEMFEQLAEQYSEYEHMAFWQSMDLTKNMLWSTIDVAITVRGSISNEFPAYGVPAIQAGWSEWSHCGLSMRADSQDEYWSLIVETIEKLRAGERVITDEQIERARLWLWFYRAGTDVPSGFVPHWESSQATRLYQMVSLALTQIESDGDAGLVAVRRMLKRREPFLTRIDMQLPHDDLADALGVVGELSSPLPDAEPTEKSDEAPHL